MATDVSSLPVNGSIQNQHGYDGAQPGSATSHNSAGNTTSEIPKDEVGWYFVEQYYTTLSRSPEKLYLFYNKRSQFVLGDETDKVAVCVGQKSINERIKDLEFHDCKVRVTNVDSQASDSNIIIQVIGEISNKSQPHRKFVQTFVLAGQTNGYFVLNDIFRYLIDEEEDDATAQETPAAQSTGYQEPVHTASSTTKPETLSSSTDPEEIEQSAQIVDKELQEKVTTAAQAPPAIPTLNGLSNNTGSHQKPTEIPSSLDAPAVSETGLTTPSPSLDTEKPKDPSPSPAVSPFKKSAEPAQASSSAKPAAPKTWANLLAASNRVATPAVSSKETNSTQPPSQSNAPAATSSAKPPAPVSNLPAAEEPSPRESSPSGSQQDEWTSVGDNRRQQGRSQANAGAQDGPQNRAYIKNVHDGIDSKQLRAALEKFGELAYFDVSRQKNCAFVDFKTAEGYKAAIEANPHHVGNERIFVEERRMKPGSYPYVPRSGMRGGRGGAPTAQGANRGSFQGGRGGFAGRGRGGNGGSVRGRGGVQAA
ncbi:hypothetical protein ANO11243_005740 [Dothideomycetidae sp. 11243]|nr:hypothetical protein ANO11243_005740 [fungal sp. No.11243]